MMASSVVNLVKVEYSNLPTAIVTYTGERIDIWMESAIVENRQSSHYILT